jgi:hypothetical protein
LEDGVEIAFQDLRTAFLGDDELRDFLLRGLGAVATVDLLATIDATDGIADFPSILTD